MYMRMEKKKKKRQCRLREEKTGTDRCEEGKERGREGVGREGVSERMKRKMRRWRTEKGASLDDASAASSWLVAIATGGSGTAAAGFAF